MILEAQPDIEVVGEAGDGARRSTRGAGAARPTSSLMDIRMPGMDGIEATRRCSPPPAGAARVLILTTFDLDEYVFDALRAGASGFLLKDAPRRASCVDAVRDGRRAARRCSPPRSPAG